MRSFLLTFSLVVLCNHVAASTIVSQVGDIDGFNSGDPADMPMLSAQIQAFLDQPSVGLDVMPMDQRVALTHYFSIPSHQSITAATLTVSIRTGSGFLGTEFFGLDRNIDGDHSPTSSFGPRATLADLLGFSPTTDTDYVLHIDLSSVDMRIGETGPLSNYNLLGDLMDGEFNVFFADDSGIDYSILSIETIPAPSTLAVCGMILAMVRRKRSRTK